MNIETISAEQIERRRREFARQKDIANRIKQKA